MKLLFELSGENLTLPFAELECVGKVLDRRLQAAVAECPNPGTAHRLAMTHVVLAYLGECESDLGKFKTLLKELAIETSQPFAGRVKKVHSGGCERNPCSQREFEHLIGTMISGPVSLKHPQEEYRAILSEDRCYFGRVLFRIDRGAFDVRNPGKREFFHPGVMMPRMVRTLVNISCADKGNVLFDPFCGTGGVLIEAEMLGICSIGSDFDPMMVEGSRQNVKETALMLADTTFLPIKDTSVDAIVTDFPYGQSVSIRKIDTIDRLYDNALGEIRRVLRTGHRAVVVAHRDIREIAAQHMTVMQHHEQRVHKSLTRHIFVLEK